jgi:patatin-like phospholipase/acyl hydrolase
MLLGAQRRSVDETETLYDDFIGKIFGSKSNLRLVTEQAMYDETELEKILYKMCGDQLLLDSNQNECPRVFCLSTKVNNNPPQTKIWRNYNYPAGQSSRYPGSFRVNTITAVRATTAAPTFFTPVQWEGGLFCDGALVANNPTAIALQEAKVGRLDFAFIFCVIFLIKY